jgi:hypothetical protein
MKIQKTFLSIALALTFTTAMTHALEVFNFSGEVGASMQFNGTASSFQFDNNVSGNQWWITSESSGSSALGLQGLISGGPWSYGAITINGLQQYATVNPTSTTLTINDGAGFLATANLVWGAVSTYQSVGGVNTLNTTVNLSGLSYSGANVDLLNFFSAPAGELSLSFQFNPAMTLSQLTAGTRTYGTSFSGSLSTVPEPGTMLLGSLGGGLLLLLNSWRRVKRD